MASAAEAGAAAEAHRGRPAPFVSEPACRYVFGLQPAFVYVPIPKAGCTTILTQIYKRFRAHDPKVPLLEGRDFELGGFHQFMTWYFTLSRLDSEAAERLLRDPQVFRFTFVRNPLARLASGFLNKFVHDRFDPAQWTHTLPVIQRVHGRRAQPWVQGVTFAQFVAYVCETPDERLDKHWRPMHRFLDERYDFFVGRMESMAADYAKVAQAAGLPSDLPHIRQTGYERDSALADDAFWDMTCDQLRELAVLPNARRLYSDELERAARERFSSDIERFGY